MWLCLILADTPGYNSYWQSEYHHQDASIDDEMITFYQTFSRLGVAQIQDSLKSTSCHFKALEVIEAHVYNHADSFQVGDIYNYKRKKTFFLISCFCFYDGYKAINVNQNFNMLDPFFVRELVLWSILHHY